MKIVSWNLKNIGESKLSNEFSPVFAAYGLGNTVLDYIVGLVTASNDCWGKVDDLSDVPADIFVMIELKTGGSNKGYPISGTCIPTLRRMVNAMNSSSVDPSKYSYQYVIPPVPSSLNGPEITGYHETVGIIYNTKSLSFVGAGALRNRANGNWINPRTPFCAEFKILSDSTTLKLIGIHAPPPSGSAAVRYKSPISYCVLLDNLKYKNTDNFSAQPNTFFMGDFNCNPSSSYKNGYGNDVYPFTELEAMGYTTKIPDGTLSSVKTKAITSAGPPYPQTAYLNDAYDNMLFNGPSAAKHTSSDELVVNMIGNSRNMNLTSTPLLLDVNKYNISNLVTAFNKVSDHLPVVIEWD